MISTENNELQKKSLREMADGRTIPPLYAEAVAKEIFDPKAHADRVNYLLRHIAKDDSIDVFATLSTVSDMPAWVQDDNVFPPDKKAEILRKMVFTWEEIGRIPMLLLHYIAAHTYLRDTMVVILMAQTPKAFQAFDKESDRYIHRMTKWTSDTGLTLSMQPQYIYVQLDKCLEQFKAGRNGEAEDGEPDELQLWLSAIADVNDGKVLDAAAQHEELSQIITEAIRIAQEEESAKKA